MIDAERLLHDLLKRDHPTAHVVPDIDVDTIDHFPTITFTVAVGQAIDNHAPPQGWEATLALNVFDDDLDDARALSLIVYDRVWAWLDQFSGAGRVAGIGHVSDVSDESIFTREATVQVERKWVTQYAGSFGLTLRPDK